MIFDNNELLPPLFKSHEPMLVQYKKLLHFRMIRLFLASVLWSVILWSCNSAKSGGKTSSNINTDDVIFLAWNEDTVRSYRFAITKAQRFYYNIQNKPNVGGKMDFTGTVLTNSSTDTLFLRYDKNRKPSQCMGYLVIEASGEYMIQFFEDSTRPVFMRKQKLVH